MKKKYFFPILSILVIFIILFLKLFPLFALNIKKYTDGEIIFKENIKLGEEFLLKYTHSVAKTPVWEFFQIDNNGKLILVETHFLDHGAGLPYTAFEDEIFISEDNRFKIKNMSREIPLPLYYRIGKIRENIFRFNKNEINLSEIVGDELITVNIIQLNLLEYISNKFLN
jgi:hypothetical protein